MLQYVLNNYEEKYGKPPPLIHEGLGGQSAVGTFAV